MGGKGLLTVDQIAEVRILYRKGESIRSIVKKCGLSRNTVRTVLRNNETEKKRKKGEWKQTKITAYQEVLDELFTTRSQAQKGKRSLKNIYAEIKEKGFDGSYDIVRRYWNKWVTEQNIGLNKAYVPQMFRQGEAFQFDWSEEKVNLAGTTTKIYLAHIKLCYSRLSFIKAYPRMTLEMVLGAHIDAHNFFKGLPGKGIYDNLKTVVTEIGTGKERIYNKQFVRLASHYMFEIIACTPAAGWEKGIVERDVRIIREKYFVPQIKTKTIDDLNEYLINKIIDDAKNTNHPDLKSKTIWEVYEEEIQYLCVQPNEFDGYVIETRKVRTDCLVQYDHNNYSVPCMYVNKKVEVHVYASKIKIEDRGIIIAEHERSFKRDQYIFNPEHYIPILQRKPGALRNGKPFLMWDLPKSIQTMWEKMISEPKGDRKVTNILSEIQKYGIEAVEKACEKALQQNLYSDAVVINLLRRSTEQVIESDIVPPDELKVNIAPAANVNEYDQLLNKKGDDGDKGKKY